MQKIFNSLTFPEKCGVVAGAAVIASGILCCISSAIYRAVIRRRFAYLKKMDTQKPGSQWVVIYGDMKGILRSYIAALTKNEEDKLRVCIIVNHANDLSREDAGLVDKVLEVRDPEGLKEFFNMRHVKLFFNAIPLTLMVADIKDDEAWAHFRNVTCTIDEIMENMEQNQGGCIITLRPHKGATPMQIAVAAYCAAYSKTASKGKKHVWLESVTVPRKALADPAPGLAQKSLDEIGHREEVS